MPESQSRKFCGTRSLTGVATGSIDGSYSPGASANMLSVRKAETQRSSGSYSQAARGTK